MMVGKWRFNPVGALARPVAARPPIASQWANPNTDKWIQLSQVLHCVLELQPVGTRLFDRNLLVSCPVAMLRLFALRPHVVHSNRSEVSHVDPVGARIDDQRMPTKVGGGILDHAIPGPASLAG